MNVRIIPILLSAVLGVQRIYALMVVIAAVSRIVPAPLVRLSGQLARMVAGDRAMAQKLSILLLPAIAERQLIIIMPAI